MVATAPGEVPRVTWSLVTAPDERERCCLVVDGVRCGHPTAFRVAREDGTFDHYTYTCNDHVTRVARPWSSDFRCNTAAGFA
jgi:hypothetical protein